MVDGFETATGAWWRRNQEIATCSTKLAHHLRNSRALLNIVVGEPIPGYLVLKFELVLGQLATNPAIRISNRTTLQQDRFEHRL